MKTCLEIYRSKWKELLERKEAHRDSIFISKIPDDIEVKTDAIMEFLSQPEFMNPVMFYSTKICSCYSECNPGMSMPTKDDLKTCAKCGKLLNTINWR